MSDTVEETVCAIISMHLDVPLEQLNSETHLERDLGMDSVDAMDVFMAICESFDVNIHPDELMRIHTIAELSALVQKHQLLSHPSLRRDDGNGVSNDG